MATMNISDARDHLPAAMETARTEAVFVNRRGRLAGVLVSPERYEQLMAALEDAEDVVASMRRWQRRDRTFPGTRSRPTSAGSERLSHRASPGGST